MTLLFAKPMKGYSTPNRILQLHKLNRIQRSRVESSLSSRVDFTLYACVFLCFVILLYFLMRFLLVFDFLSLALFFFIVLFCVFAFCLLAKRFGCNHDFSADFECNFFLHVLCLLLLSFCSTVCPETAKNADDDNYNDIGGWVVRRVVGRGFGREGACL